jgi:hypothetical protein
MVSLSDHEDSRMTARPPKRTFTFTNDLNGDTRRVSAETTTDAWVGLSFALEIEVEALVEQGWTMLFERDRGKVPLPPPDWNDNAPRPGELCGKVADYFTPCILPRGHEGPCQR